MAYKILGTIYKIFPTENITTSKGNQLTRRNIVLEQKRFDPNTGEPFQSNFPILEFSGARCAELDKFKTGDKVQLNFDVVGTTYEDRTTKEEAYMTRLRAFSITLYVQPQQTQTVQQPVSQVQPQPTQQPAPEPQPQSNGFASMANDPGTIHPQPSPAPSQPDMSFLNQ